MKKFTAFITALSIALASYGIVSNQNIADEKCGNEIVYAADVLSDYSDQVVVLVNQERAKKGLKPLKTAPVLNEMATVRSNELVEKFDHERPDGSRGLNILYSYGLNCWAAGENIAAGYSTPKEVVTGWMNSEGHRANILDEDFEYIGVGAVKASSGYGMYWTQLFYKLQEPLDDEYIPVEKTESKGDTDSDGEITAYDALVIAQAIVSGKEADAKKYDVNGDGSVTMEDALVILQYVAGKIDKI